MLFSSPKCQNYPKTHKNQLNKGYNVTKLSLKSNFEFRKCHSHNAYQPLKTHQYCIVWPSSSLNIDNIGDYANCPTYAKLPAVSVCWGDPYYTFLS